MKLSTPAQQLAAIERAAGALLEFRNDPGVVTWAGELRALATAASRATEMVDFERRLRALEQRTEGASS